MSERRFQYEAEVKANPQNYDSWFDYIRLEESAGDFDKVREPDDLRIPSADPLDHTPGKPQGLLLWGRDRLVQSSQMALQ